MIDIEVEKLGSNFIQKYSLPQDKQNHFKLDLTLYSCNLLDYILNFQFLPRRIEQIEEEILEASAYLGLCLYITIVRANPSVKVDLSLSDYQEKEIKLSVSNILPGSQKPSVVKLSGLLKTIFPDRKNRLSSLKGEKIETSLTARPMEQVALGLALCFSSYYEGPLAHTNEEELSTHFHLIFNYLAVNLENIIKINNPLLEKQDILPLINPSLIGPPIGYKESLLAQRAVVTLADKLAKSEMKESDKEQFYRALLKMPDIHNASIGFVFVASSPNRLSSIRELGEFAMNYPMLCSSLRGAYQYLRSLGGVGSWEMLIEKGDFSSAWDEIDIEHSSGLLPFIYPLKIEELLVPDHFLFYEFLAHGKFKEAVDSSHIIAEKSKTPSLILTLVLSSLHFNNISDSAKLLETLPSMIEDKQTSLELENCLRYILNSIWKNEEKITSHKFSPVKVPTLWNLNYLYTKAYIEDRNRYGLPLDLEALPINEEEGLSSLTEFHSFLVSSKVKRIHQLKLNSTPYNYWLEAIKLAKTPQKEKNDLT